MIDAGMIEYKVNAAVLSKSQDSYGRVFTYENPPKLAGIAFHYAMKFDLHHPQLLLQLRGMVMVTGLDRGEVWTT